MAYPFVGRKKEISIFQNALDAACSGTGSFLLITGETGIGKTRLLEEYARIAKNAGTRVIFTRCVGIGAPYSILEDALSQANESLAEPLPLALAFSDGVEKAGETAARARTMVLERFMREFEKLSAVKPCVFLIDDIQLADAGTLGFLHYLSRNVRKLKLVVVGSFGSEYTATESGFTRALRNMNIERNIHIITLSPLKAEESAKLILEILGTRKISKKFIDTIYTKTGGNPFFIEEMCRAIQQQGLPLKELEKTLLEETLVPSEIKNFILSRLRKLGENAIKVLRAGAVLGNSFEYDALSQIVEMDEETLLDTLEYLINQGYLREEKEGTYLFNQNLVKDTVYSETILPRRKMLHRRAGEILSRLHGNEVRYAGIIGRHYLLAEEYEKAAPLLLKAAENALQHYTMEDALSYAEELENALKKMEKSEATMELEKKVYYIIGSCKLILSDFNGAITAYEKALQYETEISGITDITVKIAHAYLSTGEFKKPFEILTTLLERTGEKEYRIRAELLGALGHCFEKTGEFGKAKDYYLQSLECALKSGDDIIVASAYHRAGTAMWFGGELEKAIEYFNRALEIRKRYNLKKEIAGTYNNMGIVYAYLGEWEKAVECYTAAKKIYEEIGDLAGVSTAYNNLAGIYADALGDHQKAVEFSKKDLEISRRTGNKYYEIYALTGIGGEYRELGMKEEAMKCYLEALELARQTGEKRIHSSLLARIGVSYAEEGDFEKAFKYIEESLALAEETGFWDIKAEVLSAKGEILALAEKYDEAEDYYLQAIQVYREAGAEELATDLYCDLARIYIRIGRKNEAKAILEDAVQFYLRTKFLEPKARKLQEEIKKLETAGSNS